MPRLDFASDRHEDFRDHEGYTTVAKDEDSVENYTLDWADDLGSETISTSTWECDGVTNDADSNTTTTTTITVSETNGTAKNTITTSDSRTLVYRIKFRGVKA